MDLFKLTERHRKIMEFWLKFHDNNLKRFQTGKWRVRYHFDYLASLEVEDSSGKPVFLCNAAAMPESTANSTILNLTSQEIRIDGAEKFNLKGKKKRR